MRRQDWETVAFRSATVVALLHAIDDAFVNRQPGVALGDHALVLDNEAAFRTGLRAMLVQRPGDVASIPKRPANRLRCLGIAVAELRDTMSKAEWERLVAALALCVGIESVVVTEDVCGLDSETAESVKRWAATALLQAALREESNPSTA